MFSAKIFFENFKLKSFQESPGGSANGSFFSVHLCYHEETV